MGKGRIRKLFPGSNSAYGFYSLYDQIAGPEAGRIIIFKGGPGTGKSSFMSRIGQTLSERGYDLEYHFCSSAGSSLDALYIPEKRIALMDGTSPHAIEPKFPGAVEEIINLGEYWEAAKLREQKDKIIETQMEVGRSFQQAYRLLAAAKLYRDALENCLADADEASVLSLSGVLLQKVLPEEKTSPTWQKPRRLFASAITPDGPVNHLGTLAGHLSHVYILNGENSVAKGKVIAKILSAVIERGYFVEVYPCAFDPQRIEHLIIPALDTAIISSTRPHTYLTGGNNSQIIDEEILHPTLRRGFKLLTGEDGPQALQDSFQDALGLAISFLSRAKMLHDELEELYIPHMKFALIDNLREEVLESIVSD